MARILAVDDVPVSLRNHLVHTLRPFDQAVLLPQAERRDETGVYKNVTFRLSGTEPDVPTTIFNPKWFTGVSAVRVDGPVVARLLNDPKARHEAMRRLRDAIPSEVACASVQVGPALDCDESDRDVHEWTAGFDGPGSFVGLYCADHSRAPDPARRGMDRVQQTSYLVCKAGAGIAGATFHMRLLAALKKGHSLEECLEKGTGPGPGPAALRRVSMAGSRNRARILDMAAKALGFPMLDTVPDQSSRGKYRGAVTQVDVAVNALRRVEDATHSTYQYTTAVDAASSQGLVSMSNASDGVILMLSAGGEVGQTLRNEAHDSIPFASPRLASERDLIATVTEEHKLALRHGDWAHPDNDFVRDRFVWKNRAFPEIGGNASNVDIEPLVLWGLYDREDYLSRFARELGIAQSQTVRLRPIAVCLAGVDSGKLRAALRNIGGGGGGGGGARATSAAAPPLGPAPEAKAPEAKAPEAKAPSAMDVSATVASTKPVVGATIEALFEERMAKLRLMKREKERALASDASDAPDAPDAPDDE